MSVNGLDSGDVAAAYQHVLSASDHWLLVHYISRDELGVLESGASGFDGLKSAIVGYHEKSPLYGFLGYRQHRVIVKYIPEGTSRLLQARTSVHFQAVVDHFVIHDAVIHFKSLDDVSETTILDALPLRVDSPVSVIPDVEDPEDGTIEAQSVNPQVSTILARLKAAKLARAGVSVDDAESVNDQSLVDLTLPATASTRDRMFEGHHTQNYNLADDRGLASPGESFKPDDVIDDKAISLREARSSARMSMDINFTPWRPKEKHFARPVTDEKLKKSQPAGFFRQRLPMGLRRGRKTSDQKPPAETAGAPPLIGLVAETQHSPEASLSLNAQTPFRRQSIQFVDVSKRTPLQVKPDLTETIVRSAEITAAATRSSLSLRHGQGASEAQSVMTPERQRLMMALSLRKKQLGALREPQNRPEVTAVNPEVDDIPYTGKTSNVDSGIDVGDTSESEDISPVLRISPPLVQTKTLPDPEASLALEAIPVARKRDVEQLHIDTTVSRQDVFTRDIRTHRLRRGGLPRTRSTKFTCVKAEGECVAGMAHKRDVTAQPESMVHDQATEDGYDSCSSNESLVEEMRGAVVEEARRISIPSSPVVKTGFCVDGIASPYSVTSIVIHTGSNRSRTTSGANSASTSCPFPQSTFNMIDVSTMTKRDNMSSSISRRIHSLNESSNCDRDGANASELSATLLARHSVSLQRPQQLLPSTFPAEDWLSSPFGDTAALSDLKHSQRPQSISVTAHIVRPKYGSGSGRPTSTRESMELQRSTLHVQQHIPEDGPSMSFATLDRVERPQSSFSPKSASRRSSVAFSSRHSIDVGEHVRQHQSNINKPMSLPDGNRSRTSLNYGDEKIDPLKQKRTARMFKRLSSTFNNQSSRHAIVESNEHHGMTTQTSPLLSKAEAPSLMAIGELDVQFPDSLLWKRRWVETNGTGNIKLSATRVSERINNIPQNYHLSQFRIPLIPSHDRQEMPCSVLLEFHHGGTIQFACGDAVSQAEVFRWLLESHRQWA